MNYNADITHCSGYLCPLAGKCKRAALFLTWASTPAEQRPANASFTSAMYDEVENKCDNFLDRTL